MKPESKLLHELNDQSKNYKVKVKVIHKASPHQSPNKKRYQRLILKDDTGNNMKATLFNKDIESFEEALQRNGEYEISDATIQPVPEQFRSKENEYQMTINDRAKINPLTTDHNLLLPQYQSIASLPLDPHHEGLVDVLAVMLYVEEIRSLNRGRPQNDDVREIVVTDHSSDRPLIISAWNELARVHCRLLEHWAEAFIVIGFIALQPRPHKGFSLTTSMSSDVILDPQGTKADSLRTWVHNNKPSLMDRQAKVLQIRLPAQERVITTTAEINSRKASTTWQEERFWLHTTMPTLSSTDMYMYLGCNKCGRRTNTQENTSFSCSYCSASNALSIPRVTLKLNLTDDSGSTEVTMFRKEVEILLGTTCTELWSSKHKNEQQSLDAKIDTVKDQKTYFQIGPTLALTTSKVLSWVVRTVVFE